MPPIHQFLAGFTNGDAISNEALVMRRIFRSWGHPSEIFSETRRILPQLRNEARDFTDYVARSNPDDVVLLHLSIGSPLNSCFASLPCRKAILYHNVTPSHYFDLYNKQTAYDLELGRRQLAALVETDAVVMADSEFNAREMTALGYRSPGVLPLILDLDRISSDCDRRILRKFSDGRTNVLFVGRCAANKRIDDIINAFAYFQGAVRPDSRLIHVGSFAGTERYYYLLLTRLREMGLNNVYFAGAVPQSELNAYYRCAHLFLCMSEHEGFCIPLLESMAHDVPVLAYAAGAVPETLDGAGILFHEKKFDLVSEMMGRLVVDARFRSAVVAGQRRRLERYRARDLPAELARHLAPLLRT
jgi:glycosyltransferase involved in cell wall biosynthesis